MHLIIEEYGAYLSKHQGRLRVEKRQQRLREVPIMHLEQILICSNGVSISSDVVRVCAEEGIPIHFLNSSQGNDYGTLVSSGLSGMALTKRAQLQAYENEKGYQLAQAFVRGKIQNQANLLRYIAKNRKETNPQQYELLNAASIAVYEQLLKIPSSQGVLNEQNRAQLMGLEGQAAHFYWQAIAQIIPSELNWPGRQTYGASDHFNTALNYGYGVLRAQIRHALLLAGLEPNAGFLHTDRPGKPSLSLDLIEEFRQAAVDRVLIGQVNRGFQIVHDEQHRLDNNTRKRIAEKVLERLDSSDLYEGKRQALRHIIQSQARHIATYVRGERPDYQPFTLSW
jgi:CRISPR-associated protein Cas1